MKRRTLLKGVLTTVPVLSLSQTFGQEILSLSSKEGLEPMAKGPFKPNWESLQQYQTPEWFRDAKFGIWAHWGPQCQPEFGDWYAREMYYQGTKTYDYHVAKYGHPSKFGFKDVINEWKAEQFNPEQLLELYKRAGAKYFMALANHHDNFDNYNSKYHAWNSVNLGPKKDLIGAWAKATKKQGLRFGVSVHASHAWSWYEGSQQADKTGDLAGVPYDGKLTKKDGKGTFWEDYDPQELYAQNHELSTGSDNINGIHKQWNWGNGVAVPSKAYCDNFYNRTVDLVNQYDPDLVYFDDTALPLWPISDAGLRFAAHFYNRNIKTKGKLEAVINGKILDEAQRKTMVWDIERGQSNSIEPLPWQTDTCIGSWHYDRRIYQEKRYKSAKTVLHTLIDVVSKNGNLMLSVPLRGDGSIDSEEQKVVEGIADWMTINSECIFATRPWKVFGEGPAMEKAAPLSAQGFNEGKGLPFTINDIRFTTKGDALYAIPLGKPTESKLLIKSLASGNALYPKEIAKVILVGKGNSLNFTRTSEGLLVDLPESIKEEFAFALKVLPA